MRPTRPLPSSRWLLACLFVPAFAIVAGAQQMTPATKVDRKPAAFDDGIALWLTGEYAAAIAHFEKNVAKDPENLALHERFARTAAGARSKASAVVAERRRTAAGDEKKVVSDEELARLEKDAAAATKALDDVIELYARWMKERPKSAVYPYALALLIDPKEEARRERLLLQAAALDPKLTEPYSMLMGLNNGLDDDAALKYAKKALDIRPDDVTWQLTYARMLWPVDQGAARRYYAEFQQKHAGTKDGASGLQQFISAAEDPAEKVALVERFRREYPSHWTPDYYTNNDVFGSYVSSDPQKGLSFAKEILAAIETPKPGADGKTVPPPAYLKTQWSRNVEYAQAVVDARTLISDKKGTEAIARLDKLTVPGSVDDEAQLDVLRAEATATTGDVAGAYDMLVTSLAADLNPGAQQAVVGYGAKLGKSPEQVDDEIWSRRMQKAETFKEFDLAKLGGEERVRLADLRGKVVLVDFWFPG